MRDKMVLQVMIRSLVTAMLIILVESFPSLAYSSPTNVLSGGMANELSDIGTNNTMYIDFAEKLPKTLNGTIDSYLAYKYIQEDKFRKGVDRAIEKNGEVNISIDIPVRANDPKGYKIRYLVITYRVLWRAPQKLRVYLPSAPKIIGNTTYKVLDSPPSNAITFESKIIIRDALVFLYNICTEKIDDLTSAIVDVKCGVSHIPSIDDIRTYRERVDRTEIAHYVASDDGNEMVPLDAINILAKNLQDKQFWGTDIRDSLINPSYDIYVINPQIGMFSNLSFSPDFTMFRFDGYFLLTDVWKLIIGEEFPVKVFALNGVVIDRTFSYRAHSGRHFYMLNAYVPVNKDIAKALYAYRLINSDRFSFFEAVDPEIPKYIYILMRIPVDYVFHKVDALLAHAQQNLRHKILLINGHGAIAGNVMGRDSEGRITAIEIDTREFRRTRRLQVRAVGSTYFEDPSFYTTENGRLSLVRIERVINLPGVDAVYLNICGGGILGALANRNPDRLILSGPADMIYVRPHKVFSVVGIHQHEARIFDYLTFGYIAVREDTEYTPGDLVSAFHETNGDIPPAQDGYVNLPAFRSSHFLVIVADLVSVGEAWPFPGFGVFYDNVIGYQRWQELKIDKTRGYSWIIEWYQGQFERGGVVYSLSLDWTGKGNSNNLTVDDWPFAWLVAPLHNVNVYVGSDESYRSTRPNLPVPEE